MKATLFSLPIPPMLQGALPRLCHWNVESVWATLTPSLSQVEPYLLKDQIPSVLAVLMYQYTGLRVFVFGMMGEVTDTTTSVFQSIQFFSPPQFASFHYIVLCANSHTCLKPAIQLCKSAEKYVYHKKKKREKNYPFIHK